MEQTKLGKSLKALSKDQWKELKAVVHSPVFNNREAVKAMFTSLRRLSRSGTGTFPTKEKWWVETFDEPFNDTNFRKYQSELFKVVMQYVGFHAMHQDAVVWYLHIANSLIEKGLYALASPLHQSIQKRLAAMPVWDEQAYKAHYELAQQQHALIAARDERVPDTKLPMVLEQLDRYYLFVRLKAFCELSNQKKIVDTDHEIQDIRPLLQQIEEKGFLKEPSFHIYYLILQLNLKKDEGQYNQLVQLIQRYARSCQPLEARDLYVYAINYANRMVNEGVEPYRRISFDLYKTALEEELLYDHGYLSPWIYKNILTLGLRLDETDWVKQFVEAYKYKVDQDRSRNAYNFGLARLHFHQQDFGKVPALLQTISYDDIYYALDIKSMLLKTHFEQYRLHQTNTTRFFTQAAKDLHQYLDRKRNKQVSQPYLDSYRNLVHFTKRLILLTQHDKEQLIQLRQDIDAAKSIADKTWLVQKILDLDFGSLGQTQRTAY